MKKFVDKLEHSAASRRSLLCVGLDPDARKLPPALGARRAPLFAFNREIIDATASHACAFKPQIAHYAAVAAERELEQTIDYIKTRHPDIPVILDAKRGDIGATAEMYAREAFERYQADAVTVNPYLGGDSLAPFLDYADKGVFILCRTSNPGGGDLQQLQSGGQSLAEHVAARAVAKWNANGNAGLVVGATHPREIGVIRQLAPDLPLLIPGIGAQGGDLEDALANGLSAARAPHGAARAGVIVNISRAIIYAAADGGGADFAAAAGDAAADWRQRINHCRDRDRNGPALE